MKKSIALVAMCATAFSPILSSAAYADEIPDPLPDFVGQTLDGMQDQCDDFAGAAEDSWAGDPEDVFAATLIVPASNATRISGPTLVDGTKDIDESTITPLGDLVPSATELRFPKADAHGHFGPFRIGGSVNMFGDQWATESYYPDSTYYYDADFDSTFAYAFKCQITRQAHHDEYVEPAVGAYVINGEFGASNDAIRGNCAAKTAQGFPIEDRPDWWGVEIFIVGNDKDEDDPTTPGDESVNGFHCRFEGTGPVTVPEGLDPPVPFGAPIDGIAIEVPQTDPLRAFEDHGGRVDVSEDYHIGQVVVCISPSSPTKKGVPGAWRSQNGYSGELCTTDWMANHAVWGSGTEDSNGTFISVPEYQLYNL